MKLVFFVIALVCAFIAAFIWGYYPSRDNGPFRGVEFFAAAFFFYLLSIAPFIS
jgi:hypothetical protein